MDLANVDPVPAGGAIDFVVHVNNEGPADAQDVQLTFDIPAQASFVSLDAPAGWSCTTGQTVTCTVASFSPGTATFTIEATTPPDLAPQTLTAIANVTTTSNDPNDDDNTAMVNVEITNDVDATVSITDAPDPVTAGDDVTYSIDVINNGPSAGPVTLAITPDAALTQVSLNGPAGWTCGTWSCSTTMMMPGTETITLVAHVDPATTGSVTIGAHVDANDSIAGNNDDSETTQVVVDADVSVTKSLTSTTATSSSWTITVTASGPSSAHDVTLTDTLPPGATPATFTAPAGWTCVGLTCTTPLLAPSSPAIFQLDTNGAAVTNTATVSSPSDNDPSNNTAVASTSADLSVAITDAPDPVQASSPIVYTVTATNGGPDAAVNASIAFNASGTIAITPPAGWSCAANTCTLAFFAPGNAVFTVNATSPGTAGATFTLQATITSASADANPANNSDTEATTVAGVAHVTGTKSVSGALVAGGAVTYTITLTNDGSGAQTDNPGDELTDVLPSGVTLVSTSASSGTAIANTGTNTVTWNGGIAAGASVTITIHATVNAGTTATQTNQATFRYDSNGDGVNDATGTTNSVALAQNVPIPTLSPLALLMFCAAIAFVAMRQVFGR